jgi:hypothetical protein
LIEAVLSNVAWRPVGSLEDVLAADHAARESADVWLRTARHASFAVHSS